MAPTFVKREQSVDPTPPQSTWSTNTFLAIGVVLVLLLIAIGATLFFLRRRQSFQLGQRERDSVAQLSWSPVTTLNSTPFASQANSPMRPSPWEKGVLQYPGLGGGSRVGSFYTASATSDTAPSSPCAFMRNKSALNLQLESGKLKEGTTSGDAREGAEKEKGEGEEDEDKRSISPLDLAQHLERLPSVKTEPTSRILELVRGSVLLGGTTFDQHHARHKSTGPAVVLNDEVLGSPRSDPPKIEPRMGVLGRRSALFSAHEIHDLFQVRNSGLLASDFGDLERSTV